MPRRPRQAEVAALKAQNAALKDEVHGIVPGSIDEGTADPDVLPPTIDPREDISQYDIVGAAALPHTPSVFSRESQTTPSQTTRPAQSGSTARSPSSPPAAAERTRAPAG